MELDSSCDELDAIELVRLELEKLASRLEPDGFERDRVAELPDELMAFETIALEFRLAFCEVHPFCEVPPMEANDDDALSDFAAFMFA